MTSLSIVIPAKNEARALVGLLAQLKELYPKAEVIVVNDGSTDDTSEVCQRSGVIEVRHPYSVGNGAAVKSGARAATGDILVFMDGDGQHKPDDISKLLQRMDAGYDMVVGARSRSSQASASRSIANRFYNALASRMVEHKVEDLTSGFRAVKANRFKQFVPILPNGFSYPTTITMAFFRAGYAVDYVPIVAEKRIGKSHINLFKDGTRFLLIIFKIATLYSPLKMFVPISLAFFITGLGYYAFTLLTMNRFTNMSALLLSTAILVFLLGLVSEQITTLIYLSRGGSRSGDPNEMLNDHRSTSGDD